MRLAANRFSFTLSDQHWRMLLLAVIALYALYFLALDLCFLWGFETSIADGGSFQQFFSLAARGVWPTTSINLPSHPETPWLGFHFTPLLFVLTPLYWLYSGPEWLVLVHVLCVAGTAWPIFLACKALGASHKEAFLWSLIYLLNIVTLYTFISEFHEQSLALPLIAYGLWALAGGKKNLLWLCVIALMLTKEHFGMSAFGFGLAYAIRHRDYRTGLAMMMAGIIGFGVINGIIMPGLNHRVFSLFDELNPTLENYHLSRYAWLKWQPDEAIGHAMVLLKSKVNLYFYLVVGGSFLGMFLFGWVLMFPVAGEWLANMLSDYFLTRTFTSYHHSGLIVALVVASCDGVRRLASFTRIPAKELTYAVLGMHLVLPSAVTRHGRNHYQ